jgi:hypothetical protein
MSDVVGTAAARPMMAMTKAAYLKLTFHLRVARAVAPKTGADQRRISRKAIRHVLRSESVFLAITARVVSARWWRSQNL